MLQFAALPLLAKVAGGALLVVCLGLLAWGTWQTIELRLVRSELAGTQKKLGESNQRLAETEAARQTLADQVVKQNEAITDLVKAALESQRIADAAIARAQEAIKGWQSEVARLRAAEAARGPDEGTCDEALAVIREGLH